MFESPRTYFGDPVNVWMETDLDEPLLCLDLSEAVGEDIGDVLLNFHPAEAARLADRIRSALAGDDQLGATG